MSFDSPPYVVAEDEDKDPVGPPLAPIELLTRAATEVGLIRPGDKMDRNLVELCMRVVDLAAAIGDQFRVPDNHEDTVGDVIRAQLYE